MGASFGIEVEGGSDTPLQNVYISKLHPSSPADNSCLKVGDQLMMCGKECVVGVTGVEAWDILRRAPLTADVVVARKKENLDKLRSSQQDLSTTSHDLLTTPQDVLQPKVWAQPRRHSISLHYGGSNENIPLLQAQFSNQYSSLEEVHDATEAQSPSQPEINEEKFTVVLKREAGQRLGFGICGGADNPTLPLVHVSIPLTLTPFSLLQDFIFSLTNFFDSQVEQLTHTMPYSLWSL